MLWGREDRLAPAEHAEAFGRTVAHARVEVLENCGHYPQLELPGAGHGHDPRVPRREGASPPAARAPAAPRRSDRSRR